MTEHLEGGARFSRSAIAAALVAVDYRVVSMRHEDGTLAYEEAQAECHERAATAMLRVCEYVYLTDS